MAGYSFVTTWRFRAPIERIWDLISNAEAWPHWWPAVEEVTKRSDGDPSGVGARYRYVFRTALPYRIRFEMTTTRVTAPHELDGSASGELEGAGRWRLSAVDGGTLVRYNWDVSTSKVWMNLLAPVARPIFTWNHDWVMESGRRGILRLIATGALR